MIIKCFVGFLLGFVCGIFFVFVAIWLIGKAEQKKLKKWEKELNKKN